MLGYELAESCIGAFGGNSNWCGLVWFFVNYLLIEVLCCYCKYFGLDVFVEMLMGLERWFDLDGVADELLEWLIGLFWCGFDGWWLCFGGVVLFDDSRWSDDLFFYEYFYGDIGVGFGVLYQMGWMVLVVDLIVCWLLC